MRTTDTTDGVADILYARLVKLRVLREIADYADEVRLSYASDMGLFNETRPDGVS